MDVSLSVGGSARTTITPTAGKLFSLLLRPIARSRRTGAAFVVLVFTAGVAVSATLDFESSLDPAKPSPFRFPLEDNQATGPAPLTGELRDASRLLTKGDAAGAEAIARQVTANEPENADAWFMLGLALANLERLEDALEPLSRASALYKLNPLPLIVKGDILTSLGRIAEAEAAYVGALEQDPANWAAQESLGIIAEAKGDFGLAIERYTKASETAPGNRLFPKLRLSRLALVVDDPDKAISVLLPVASTGQEDDRLFDLLARAYLAKADLEAAKPYLSKLVEGGRSVYGFVGLARVALSEGDAAEAERLMSEAVGKWPNDPALALENGNVLGAVGRYPEALAVYDAVLAADPSNIAALRARGLTLVRLDRTGEAFAVATAIVALEGATAGDHVWLGSLQEASGDAPGAVGSYQAAIGLDPDNWVALNNLAALLSGSDPAQAVAFAERAATLAPEVPAVQDTLAWALFKAGDVLRASQMYEGLLAASPDDPSLLYRLGMVRLSEGRSDEGRRMIETALAADPDSAYAAEAKAALGQD